MVLPVWVDAHCHVASSSNQADWEKKAQAANVVAALSCAVDRESIRFHFEHVRAPFWACVGQHPLESASLDVPDADFEGFVSSNKGQFVGIGEIGLDFSKKPSAAVIERQEKVFSWWLQSALKWSKPVIVHSRGAEERVLELLEEHRVRHALLHWFAGSSAQLSRAMQDGFFVSVGPSVLYSKKTREIALASSRDRLVLETDAPVPFNGEATNPSWIPRVGAGVAALWGVRVDEVAAQTTANARQLFGL